MVRSLAPRCEDTPRRDQQRQAAATSLPRAGSFNLVNSSDASFVSRRDDEAPCLPGKTINLMACSQPIIAMVAEESETANVIRKAECGIVVKPWDALRAYGLQSSRFKEDASLREAMGSNGRRYLERNMSLEKNVALYEAIFHVLAGDGVLARKSIPSMSEDAPGIGHHGS